MIRLSRNDIESISRKVLKGYFDLPQFRGINITKIEPDVLAQEVLHLNLDFVHLSLDGETLGVTSYDEVSIEAYDNGDDPYLYLLDGKTILVERDLKDDIMCIGRCNFSIAHETSHQIFGILFPQAYGNVKQSPQLHFYRPKTDQKARIVTDWTEWQANTLASALLMPKEVLIADMKMFGLGEKIAILNSVFYQETFFRFRLLAEYLGVSQQALMIRMKYLGLIDKEYLNRARSMLDISKE